MSSVRCPIALCSWIVLTRGPCDYTLSCAGDALRPAFREHGSHVGGWLSLCGLNGTAPAHAIPHPLYLPTMAPQDREYICACKRYCKGQPKKVSRTTYYEHTPFREAPLEAVIANAVSSVLNIASAASAPQAVHSKKRKRLTDSDVHMNIPLGNASEQHAGPSGSQVPPHESSVPPRESSVPPREPSVPPREPSVPPHEPSVPPREPSVPPREPSVPPREPSVPPREPSVPPREPSVPPREPSVPPREPSVPPREPSVPPREPSVPPRAPVEEDLPHVEREYGDANPAQADPLPTLRDLQIAQEFADALKTASLTDSGLDEATIERLQNPLRTVPDLSQDRRMRLALRLFIANHHSEDNYRDNRDAILEYDPDSELLSYERMQGIVRDITGITPLVHDMCEDTCIAYTGPFADLDKCPVCSAPRYETRGRKRVPRRTFQTLPFGPQAQAMYRSRDNAERMRYRANLTEELLGQLADGMPFDVLEDTFYSNDYLNAVQNGLITPDDMTLMFSIDGAQLYESKQSDCWMYIWVLFDLSPGERYKKRYVFPGAVIPGPKKPKNIDSFVFPGLYHIAALQREGFMVWDAARQRLFRSHPIIIFVTADSPGMAYMNGLVGHHGAQGCRLFCPQRGRRKPRQSHYYPAMLKPHNYHERGCDHDDVPLRPPPPEPGEPPPKTPTQRYNSALRHLLASRTPAEYERRRLETGIVKTSIFSGLPLNMGLPGCFPGDMMHHVALNLTDLIISHLHGTIRCSPSDDTSTWDWACLSDDTAWQSHGGLIGAAAKYLPGSFDCPPRNPAEKISSGYKAWEFYYYVFGLLPGFLWSIQDPLYFNHFCKLVSGIRFGLKRTTIVKDRALAHARLLEYVNDYEKLYYQRRIDRLHFIRQSIHLLVHIIPEGARVGPGSLHTQWILETAIGNLTAEIRLHSKAYANLSERAARRGQVNALYAIFPELAEKQCLPRGAVQLADGYVLLPAKDRCERYVSEADSAAVHAYLDSLGMPDPGWRPVLWKWARIRLPNGQIARCAWKEAVAETRLFPVRRARMVKLHRNIPTFAEVQYYFALQGDCGEMHHLAMVSLFTPPDSLILTQTSDALLVCRPQADSRLVVSISDIVAVVGMVPLPPKSCEQDDSSRFFVVEKLGLDSAWCGRVESADQDDLGPDEDNAE